MNSDEVRRCVQRQMPMLLPQIVRGSIVATHVEKGLLTQASGRSSHQTNAPVRQARESLGPSSSFRSHAFTGRIEKARAPSWAPGSWSRSGNQDLRKVATLHSLQNLMSPDGKIQQQNRGVFSSPAGTEVSAAVSGGLSTGFQSLNNRQDPSTETHPGQQVDTPNRPSTVGVPNNPIRAGPDLDISKSSEACKASNALVAGTNRSAQIRHELDSNWSHYLRPEGKGSVGRPGNKCKISPVEHRRHILIRHSFRSSHSVQ